MYQPLCILQTYTENIFNSIKYYTITKNVEQTNEKLLYKNIILIIDYFKIILRAYGL
jgi:methyltransferase-like protein